MAKQKDGFLGEQALVLPPAIVQRMKTEPATSVLYITDIGYYPKAYNHFRERDVPIDQYVFIYCTEGRGWFSLDGQKHPVAPNQYFILPAGSLMPMAPMKKNHGQFIGFTSGEHWLHSIVRTELAGSRK